MDPLKVPASQESKLHFLDYWRIIRIRKTVILAVFLLVVITATLVTFILPESYSSKCRIKVERDQSDIIFTDARMNGGYDPYFIQTEFETIQSERVLSNVVALLDLKNEWGKKYNDGKALKTDEAIGLLKGKIDLRPVRNTSYIEIIVYSEKPDEAAKLANAIGEAYQEYRHEVRKRLSGGGIDSLEQRIKEQEKKIADQQKVVDDLRELYGVPDSVVNAD